MYATPFWVLSNDLLVSTQQAPIVKNQETKKSGSTLGSLSSQQIGSWDKQVNLQYIMLLEL